MTGVRECSKQALFCIKIDQQVRFDSKQTIFVIFCFDKAKAYR
ncbi:MULTISPECIES: hypothetical protein [Photorhabdus]|uniref:Uncharacterized protein n=1 Tax=Photorhabdus bodei TaxID=2029681 RepID=A0AAW6BLL2_9GAMM|nr:MULTISPECIES: hypothetical protein [Photorhabdus]MDB6366630.1 hypothetical protein [Photorhabdus bodei]MDB6372832.1 hypothetical protein [Photorhabdus bodei]